MFLRLCSVTLALGLILLVNVRAMLRATGTGYSVFEVRRRLLIMSLQLVLARKFPNGRKLLPTSSLRL